MNPIGPVVNGARWVRYDGHGRRFFIWQPGSPMVSVVHEDTGEAIGDWPCDPTAEAAEALVEERIRAGY